MTDDVKLTLAAFISIVAIVATNPAVPRRC
jgi:hypothetical protein